MVRLGRAVLARAQIAAQPEELAPRAGHVARIETALDLIEAMLGFVDATGGEQRLDGDELGFDHFRRAAPTTDRAISSAIASAASGVPRRVARRAVIMRTDHSYQRLVCRPYAP